MNKSIGKEIISLSRPFRYVIDFMLFKLFADVTSLQAMHNKHRNRPMLVVGNGPSLNKTPLDSFVGVPSIGMNKIDLIYSRTKWRPSIIVCLNNLVAKQHQDQFANSEVPVFLGWKARWLLKSENRNKVDFFNAMLSNRFSRNAIRGFGSSATVTYVALQMAYWMGANPVIIVGVDHSFNYKGRESTYQKREGEDVNHFDPNYFKSGSYWGTPDLDQSEIEYQLAKDAFEADSRKIYDATVDGKLEVFEKIEIEDALELINATN